MHFLSRPDGQFGGWSGPGVIYNYLNLSGLGNDTFEASGHYAGFRDTMQKILI